MELTFLEKEQVFGDSKLDIIKKMGTKAVITDFSILLGGYVENDYYVGNNKYLDERTGCWWTKSTDGYNCTIIFLSGDISNHGVYERCNGARPVLSLTSIPSISRNKAKETKIDGILEIEYGYYPRSAVSSDMQRTLEKLYGSKKLTKTGNIYTTDSRMPYDYDLKFIPQKHIEYEYNGKRYIRVCANPYSSVNDFTLSNGRRYNSCDHVWVNIEPVKWLVDENEKIMITKEIIFAGIQFKNEDKYIGDFSKTDIKEFMNTYLSKELFQIKKETSFNEDIIEQYTKMIRKLHSEGYSIETIKYITDDTLSTLSKKENVITKVKKR